MKVDAKYIKWLLGNALACIKRVIITSGISLRALLKYKSCYKIVFLSKSLQGNRSFEETKIVAPTFIPCANL